MNIVQESLALNKPLSEAYLNDFSSVEQLYQYDAMAEASWRERLNWLQESEHLRIPRKQLVERLREYNRAHNPHEAVAASLDTLEKPGTVVIVGGQQSGLFSGPLLVIYKAVTIIKAAQQASQQLDHPVVPVFWIAGEDHDWDEVNHTYVLSPELSVTRVRIARETEQRLPVSLNPIASEEWEQAISELEQLLPETEFRPGLMELLRQVTEGVASLSDAFAKLMGSWFGKYGLVLLDSADPVLRELEAPVFERMIDDNDRLGAAYRAAADLCQTLGYQMQADVAEDGANLFYIHDSERLLLFKHHGRFSDRKGKVSFTADELKAELKEHPERFSNNVLTRPLMQDSLLPVLGTVLGTGEIAYWALTGSAFKAFGLRMPLLLNRESFTVIEGTLHKHMDKYNLSWNDVSNPEVFGQKREAWLAEQDGLHLDDRFEQIKQTFTELYDPLIEQLGDIQAGLIKLGTANREKIVEQMEYLRGRAKDALSKANSAGLRHFDRIEFSLFPQHKPQERVYNVFYYLNRYGSSWIDNLLGIPYDITGKHRIIYL
ncbi:bacillithiol biosynthesis cysteine-adding enzyme BshC [Paenibacillus aceti]|uniref:Putative cysteine ligase BshC n=1 Tax=Paenibacillus aceti TaxID=1820010 RepID=A0ABQ1VN58_9BACL|nr:bacillithiol biosynthesis cysteine-adding enzyme BshC [Paenibacillus aceti]GGF82834.1 putative cysteine ligase BshC [Paenibacillus aceti]